MVIIWCLLKPDIWDVVCEYSAGFWGTESLVQRAVIMTVFPHIINLYGNGSREFYSAKNGLMGSSV